MRTDILLRSVEEMHALLEKFIYKSKVSKASLKAQQEEITIHSAEIQEAQDIFQEDVIVGGTDPISQRIAAEKFIR